MCGIGGFQGNFAPAVLSQMSACIAHRGPDDRGDWYNAATGAGLTHRRLAILDTSPLGHQPMVDAETGSVIVFNGEIYNFRDLRAELEHRGHRFRSQSDTEVLLALYRAHGEGMLSRLNGIFALAIHDSRSGVILVACDAFGVKPLYVTQTAEGVAFASELKGLLACGSVNRAIDLDAIHRALAYLWIPGGSTLFRHVRRLAPGEALLLDNGSIARRWIWAQGSWPSTTPTPMRAADAIALVRQAVRSAVHRQMVSDVPVGAFLSGGLDSSAVVSMAREVSPTIDCFTIDSGNVHDAGMTDDLPYARRVARHLGVKLHEVRVDASRMASDVESMVHQLEEPLADPAPLNVLYISRLARQVGAKVLLSGAGGDDLFTGYRRHRALLLEKYWAWLPTPARAVLRKFSGALGRRSGRGRRLARAFAYADWPADRRMMGYFLWLSPRRVLELFSADARNLLAQESLTTAFHEYLDTLPRELAPLNRMLALEQRFFLADHNLLYTDKMSMQAGIEVRVPFLDNEVVRVANSLPPALKQSGRHGKWVLKKAMEPYLPHDTIYRVKTGFGAPLRHWLRHELRPLVDDLLSEETIRRRGMFDAPAVTALVAGDREGRIDAAYTVFSLMCVEIWMRRFSA